jgi:simple sugar transport system permease protein
VSERAGILNLGIEGLMAAGACLAFGVALASGSAWLGLGAAVLVGALLALFHALPAALLRVDQVVSGLALLLVSEGLAIALGQGLVGRSAPGFEPLFPASVAGLPLVGRGLLSHGLPVYLSLLLAALVALALSRTRPGLYLSVCGENPRVVDAAGGAVAAWRIGACAFGGAMAGAAGAALTLAETRAWVDGVVGGRGFIALALVIFSGWSPGRLVLGAWLFGGLVALRFQAQALDLGLPPGGTYALAMVPYLATIAVLALGRGRSAPASLGRPYAREARD